MFKLNKKMEYALIALKHILHNKKQKLTTAKEICARYKTPFDPTARALQIMAQNSILKAEQGVKGGYKLNGSLKNLSFKKLSNIIVGPIKITHCQEKSQKNKCDRSGKCIISKPLTNLNKKINIFFEDIKLEDLLRG